jgi:PDZ domain-containing protein
VVATLAVALGIGGAFLKVPYVALIPGSARDTEPLLAVSGIEEFPSDGELLLTTVRVRQRPNLWEYLWLTLDDDANVLPEERILQDRSPEENRQFNLAVMQNSKDVAVAVALEALGYEAITTDGVVVQALVEESPAESVLGLGDTIVAIDDTETLATEALVDLLLAKAPGDEVTLTVERLEGGDTETLDVVLGEHPDGAEHGFLGIQPVSRPRYGGDVPFEVDIDTGEVGGPSAGLAFSLAVLDQLTEGELTGGATVAVTGSISPDGSIGPVGGVQQKAAAVREIGADAFIVPAALAEDDLEAVRERAGDDLQIIPVSTLDEALDALGELGGETAAVAEFAAGNTPTG